MLVLSRKQKQQVHASNDIIVTVLQIKGNTVKLGFEAPPEINFTRAELLERNDKDSSGRDGKDSDVGSSAVLLTSNERKAG